MNKTLMEKARSMLSGTSLEQRFWVEVVSIACYLINKSPTLALVDKTLIEAWSDHKLSLRHLRVFGCKACMYIQSSIDLFYLVTGHLSYNLSHQNFYFHWPLGLRLSVTECIPITLIFLWSGEMFHIKMTYVLNH